MMRSRILCWEPSSDMSCRMSYKGMMWMATGVWSQVLWIGVNVSYISEVIKDKGCRIFSSAPSVAMFLQQFPNTLGISRPFLSRSAHFAKYVIDWTGMRYGHSSTQYCLPTVITNELYTWIKVSWEIMPQE